MLFRFLSRLVVVIFISFFAAEVSADVITLKGVQWNISIDPATLEVTAKPLLAKAITISDAREQIAKVADLAEQSNQLTWTLPDEGIAVSAKLEKDVLSIEFVSDKPGKLTWPLITNRAMPVAYILPLHEGSYVPNDDLHWRSFLIGASPLNTTADLSMPFFGLDRGSQTVTYILTNPFNNEMKFDQSGESMRMEMTHEFTRNRKVKSFGYRIHLGDASPITPARIYRQHLIDSGEFVSLTKKIEQTPDVAKLAGAAHIYLWGDGLIARPDIKDYQKFAKKMIEAAVGQRLLSLMSDDHNKLVKSLCTKEWIDNFDKGQVTAELDVLLHRRDLYDAQAWKEVALSAEAKALLEMDNTKLSQQQINRRNVLLLHAAFAEVVQPVDSWGDGFSTKMLRNFAAAGLDRLWLGSPNWKGLADHPQFVAGAIAQGFLVGPYDSYHSIHSPAETDTWETAQFDQKLYDSGGVTKADGTKKKGFKQKGYILNCAVARPYVEARVTKLMDEFKCNSWFMDCDGFGELFDDYSLEHPATQEDDQNARVSRLKWINAQFHAVIGSEGGSAYAAPAIHFAHGIMTPVIGWGDPDLMKDDKSKYFLGRYFPPDGPTMFFKQVPMKEEYDRVHTDPRFRLPLYQIVFHDSVIATHQWGSASLKFEDPKRTRELLELLYNVPPMYHLNLAEWEKRKAEITSHYQFWSPIHRETATLPMSEFEWLSEDRTVQRTRFGDELELIANLSDEIYKQGEIELLPHTIQAKWLRRGNLETYPQKN